MHVRSLLCSLAVCVSLCASAHAQKVEDLVLASVNGEDISVRQLTDRLVDYRADEALEKMINRAILLQEAKRLNLSVTDKEIADKLAELTARFRNDEDYRGFLTRSRLTEAQLRDEIRHTILAQKAALKEAPITDADLELYDARVIIALDKAAAEKIVKDLGNGADFTRLATDRSEDLALRRASGRLKPFLKIEMLDVARAIDEQKLKPGEYTKTPVALGERWGIVKLENRIPVSTASASERNRLETGVTAFRIDQWMTQSRAKAKVVKNSARDATVAVVNDEPLPREQLVKRLLEFQGEEALSQLVNRTLLVQSARKLKVEVTDAEADKLLADFRGQFQKPEAYQSFLAGNNVTEKQFRDELRYRALLERVALKENPITDQDLEQFDIRIIVAPTRAVAEGWIKDLDGGIEFALMAAQRSIDPQGRQAGGRMKPFVKVEMLDVWRAIDTHKLKPGSYTKTPVLLADGSFVLIKLENVIPASQAAAAEKTRLSQAVTRYRVDRWLATARGEAKISHPVALTTVTQAR